MIYSLHPGVEHDIANALDFYKGQTGLVVAERFLEEFERVVKLLIEYPDLGTPTSKGRRIFPLKVFPYSVVYRSFESSIRVLIVRHLHRKPSYAGARR